MHAGIPTAAGRVPAGDRPRHHRAGGPRAFHDQRDHQAQQEAIKLGVCALSTLVVHAVLV